MKKIFTYGCSGCLVVLLIPVLVVTITALRNGRVGCETDLSKSAVLVSPPAALSEPVTLTVMTYNIQSLWVVGQNRPARMRALGEKLTELDPDIVGFQEAFVDEERQILIDALAGSRLKHHQYFKSATVGSGLLISSALPIKEAFFWRYTVSNPWFKLWEGDWWAGKGVALARIELPDGKGMVDLFDTHAQAGYGNPDYKIIRKEQMAELAQFVNDAGGPNNPAFLVGDMNCRAGDADFETAVSGADLKRVMAVDSSIDHIFAVDDPAYIFEVVSSQEINEHNGIELSDHRGYLSVITISPSPL